MRRFAQTAATLNPECGAECIDVAGGVASYVGEGSPVNRACGLGFSGEVTHAHVELVERFFLDRGVRPLLSVSPLADASLVEVLARRGWTLDGFENVFVRELGPQDTEPECPADIEIREALTPEDRDLWALVAATGFSDPLPPLAGQLALGEVVVNRPGTRLFLAFVDGGSRVAGTGELYVEQEVAWLSADTTLPLFRRRGIQQALQRHRLALGASLGATLAVTEAAPGSGSQRNIERCGFRLAYTRADLVRELPEGVR